MARTIRILLAAGIAVSLSLNGSAVTRQPPPMVEKNGKHQSVLTPESPDRPGWIASGEWEGTAELEMKSDVDGIVEESLDIASNASLELTLNGLDIELMPSFDELISDVRRVKINNVPKAIEGVSALKDDVINIDEGKIDEDLRAEWLIELDAIRTDIEKGRFDEAVGRLRAFRRSVRKAYEIEKLKRKSDAKKLRSKAKKAIRNINNIEGLKEDVIDFTCIPFGSDSELDCIPIDIAKRPKNSLEMAKVFLKRHQNTAAVGWMRDFIGRVEEAHNQGYIISKEADSLISKAETIIGKIDKGKSERDFELNLSATIAPVELVWELQTEDGIFPVPGKDNRDITLNLEADADLDDLGLTLEVEHQELEFFERWSEEKGKLVDGLDFEAKFDLADLEITRTLTYEETFFPEGIGKEIEVARVDEAKRAIERLKQEIEGSPSIPDETKEDPLEELQDAMVALDENQRDEAVDDLWDFIDLVERRRREEKISEDDANWLITRARAILPRKRIRTITAASKAGFNLYDLELKAEYESTIKDLPADTKKKERDDNLEVGLQMKRGNLSLESTIEHQRKRFPNNKKKDKLVRTRQLEADLGIKELEITGAFERKTTDYPNNSVKNNVAKMQSLELNFDLEDAECTLVFEKGATSYPNKSKKDKLVEDVEIVLEFARPESTIDLERKLTTYPNNMVKDKIENSIEFQSTWKPAEDMEFSLTAGFSAKSYLNDLAKDKTSASLEMAVQQDF